MVWLGLAGATVKDQFLLFLKERVKLEEPLIAIEWTVESRVSCPSRGKFRDVLRAIQAVLTKGKL